MKKDFSSGQASFWHDNWKALIKRYEEPVKKPKLSISDTIKQRINTQYNNIGTVGTMNNNKVDKQRGSTLGLTIRKLTADWRSQFHNIALGWIVANIAVGEIGTLSKIYLIWDLI